MFGSVFVWKLSGLRSLRPLEKERSPISMGWLDMAQNKSAGLIRGWRFSLLVRMSSLDIGRLTPRSCEQKSDGLARG
jgi:hypothetical protein